MERLSLLRNCKVSSSIEEAVWKSVVLQGKKWSTRLNHLIDLQCALTRRGELVPVLRTAIKAVKKVIEQMLLREVPDKAPLLTVSQLARLVQESEPRFAVPFALMLPAGARFADVAKIRGSDVVDFESLKNLLFGG